MQKLGFQDAAFLRMESLARPYHVACFMIFSEPEGARAGYTREIADYLASEIIATEPIFRRRLADPTDLRNPAWIDSDIAFDYHLRHYALPRPGRWEDLMGALANAHAPRLHPGMPLWEMHLIDGLPRKRFALYMKVHHALIDGVSGIRLLSRRLLPEPVPASHRESASTQPAAVGKAASAAHPGLLEQIEHGISDLLSQGRALPDVAAQLLQMGRNRREDEDLPPLPFTAPPSILNQQGGPRRSLMTVELPLSGLREIGSIAGGTINDSLVAVSGGALRHYLQEQRALPKSSLLATLPVSLKSKDDSGNTLSMIMCPLGTNVADPRMRLERIVKVTQKAKRDLQGMTDAGRQDMMNLIMLPIMALSMTHTTDRFSPVLNLAVSNVIGPTRTQYLADARLEAVYPISLLSEMQALNVTAISYHDTVFIGILACPDGLTGLDSLPKYLEESYSELHEML
jgi:diacylglycerol O-acyltransferase